MKRVIITLVVLLSGVVIFVALVSIEARETREAKAKGLSKFSPSPKQRIAWEKVASPIYEINFNKQDSNNSIVYAKELGQRAKENRLELVPDSSLRGMQDFEAAVIPSSGLRFELDAPVFSRVYLYLDLVSYKASGDKKNRDGVYPKAKAYWLEISVNSHKLKLLYQSPVHQIKSPLVIPIDLEYIPRGKLKVLLQPSLEAGAIFAIWDVFVSRHSKN